MTNLDLPLARDGGWHPERIKMAIRVRGKTLTKLATDNNLVESACRVSLVRPHSEADRVISRFLAVPLHILWPSRYDEDGNDIRHERDYFSDVRDEDHRLIRRAV
ncbi:helix-turn-helix domain-containing protein [Klebsiella pneumoniae]|uniref:helix-turn-helix domain-containing protein n=1 Tax=Klebsiella pneumoniae TaxID=573 RepID=UPI0034DF3427